MASCSCKVFVAVVDEKLMAYLKEFDINDNVLISNSESAEFSSDSSEGILPDIPPTFLKRRQLNVKFEKIPL